MGVNRYVAIFQILKEWQVLYERWQKRLGGLPVKLNLTMYVKFKFTP